MKNKNHQCFSIVIVLVFLISVVGAFGQSDSLDGLEKKDKNKAKTSAYVTNGCSDSWDTNFTTNGTNGEVYVITPNEPNGYYIGGSFTMVNGVAVSNLAKWDGTNWSALGAGVVGRVDAIAVSGNDVYVGGDFRLDAGSPRIKIAKWDGNSWSALGSGLFGGGGSVVSIVVSGSDVYIAGSFSLEEDSPRIRVAQWDGSSWSEVGDRFNSTVNTLAINNGTLYAGGVFWRSGETDVFGVAEWDGTSWSTVGNLIENTEVTKIVFSGGDLYAIGRRVLFPGGGGRLTKWDGNTWTAISTPTATLSAIAVLGTDIYVGGFFDSNNYNYIAKYNGTNWTSPGGGIGSNGFAVRTLAVLGDELLVGGNFHTAGGMGAKNIAKYSNEMWSSFSGTGIDAGPTAIAVSGTDVYVGGNFTTAGTITANRIAKWDSVTNTWSPLGSGTTGNVRAIAVAGDKVYAGGVSAGNIAVWDGKNWSPLGTGVNGTVSAITVDGEDVYVGGSFQTAGGVTANRIAKWDGSSWSGLDSGIITSSVNSIVASGNNLYVGVNYTTLNGPQYFLKYDGTTWTQLGDGMTNGGVSSIAVVGSDVYVAGGFSAVGGISVAGVAKWNGSTWSTLGSGIPGNTSSLKLATSGTDIIAVGNFTTAGGVPANRIARWNGTSWSALGLGLDDDVGTVTASGSEIYVGGSFITAGCNSSPFFARWRNSQWTGSNGTDWHSTANWSDGTVPAANAGITIALNDATISSADVTLSSLIVSGDRTVTVGGGRTLTVNGRLDLSDGSLNGTGTLIVNGDLNLNNGNITGLSTITVNGNLYLGGGNIAGTGSVAVTQCRASAISGGGLGSFVDAMLTRCVNSNGSYRFPVGSNGIYAGVELSAINGSGTFTVEPKSGAYSSAAAGLPANRLQRWWSMVNSGIVQADMNFKYVDSEVVSDNGEDRYKVFAINGGTAELRSTSLDTMSNHATVSGQTAFSAFTLADGPSTLKLMKGRVRGASGRGAESVIVTLTDQLGNVRYSITNPFGYYKFPNVLTWENYTVQVNSKRFTFGSSSQSFEFNENPADIDFTATDH